MTLGDIILVMKKLKVLIITLIGLAILLVGCSATPKVGTGLGDEAPDFTLTDIDGNEVSLSDFKGQVVVINFWATTCSACVKELPIIEEFYQKWQDEVVLLTINEDFNQTHIGDIVRNSGYHFPVLLDNQTALKAYQLQFIPATFFIDPEGIIRADAIGAFTNLEHMEEKLEFAMPQEE